MGWTAVGAFPSVIGDVRTLSTCRVVRLWSDGGAFTARVRDVGQRHRTRVMVGAIGHGTIQTEGGELELRPKFLILTHAHQSLYVTATQPWARYIWEVELAPGLAGDIEDVVNRVMPLSESSWLLFVSLSNSVLNNAEVPGDTPKPTQSGKFAPFLGEAFSYAMSAIISDSIPRTTHVEEVALGIYERAMALIALRHRDPTLAPSPLARELSVSVSTLYRAFRLQQTSPAKMIEEHRRLSAVSSIGKSAVSTAKEMALASGFTSVRQMRNAFARHTLSAGGRDERAGDFLSQ